MKLEVKNVKVLEANSDETLCFSATLYADGKKVCTASNYGHGGPNMYDSLDNPELFREVEKFANVQKIMYGEIEIIQEKLDCLVDELISEYLFQKDIKKSIKKGRTPFKLKTDPEGMIRELTGPQGTSAEKYLHDTYGDKLETIYH